MERVTFTLVQDTDAAARQTPQFYMLHVLHDFFFFFRGSRQTPQFYMLHVLREFFAYPQLDPQTYMLHVLRRLT